MISSHFSCSRQAATVDSDEEDSAEEDDDLPDNAENCDPDLNPDETAAGGVGAGGGGGGGAGLGGDGLMAGPPGEAQVMFAWHFQCETLI